MIPGRMATGLFCATILLFLGSLMAPRATAFTPAPVQIGSFLQQHCFECHDSETKKGGLDLTALEFDLKNAQSFTRWVKVQDRVTLGEMPPKKKPRPSTRALNAFTNSLGSALLETDQQRISAEGRATQRRLNRFEYEDTLRDLLA